MKKTIREIIDKVHEIDDVISAMDRLHDDYSACMDAADLLSEYKSLILKTEVDL